MITWKCSFYTDKFKDLQIELDIVHLRQGWNQYSITNPDDLLIQIVPIQWFN